LVTGMYLAIANNPEVSETFSQLNRMQALITFSLLVGVTAIFIFLIWLFYKLLYGLLLKRLNQNYNELKKLEV
jgi:flagellar biogenesis protein FliO